MKKTETNKKNILSLNKIDTTESISQDNKVNLNDDYMDYIKANFIQELEVVHLIDKLNNLPSCLNEFLSNIVKTPKGFLKLIEIRMKNIKIKEYSYMNDLICKWCKIDCMKNGYENLFQEIEMSFSETNSKICCCSISNHDLFNFKGSLQLTESDISEINKIIDLYKDKIISINDEKDKLIKKEILKTIKNKEPYHILTIIFYLFKLMI